MQPDHSVESHWAEVLYEVLHIVLPRMFTCHNHFVLPCRNSFHVATPIFAGFACDARLPGCSDAALSLVSDRRATVGIIVLAYGIDCYAASALQ